MPRSPQTAVVRLLQTLTDSRNIAPGDRIAITPHAIVLGPLDGLAVLKAFRLGGGERVADPSRVLLFTDENVPSSDAARREQLLEAARQCGITRVVPHGGCEIEHLIEQGLIVPGECAVSNLPRIAALGGIGALGLRVTVRDLAAMLAGKPLRVTVPDTVRIDLAGKPAPYVSGWDMLFAIRRELKHEATAGAAVEIGANLALHERLALCRQSAHAGAFAAYCIPDRAAVQELNKRISRKYTAHEPERGATYARRGSLDLSTVTLGILDPDGTWRPLAELTGRPISTVVIRAGIEGLRAAAAIIKPRRIADGVRCTVIPASAAATGEAVREGLTAYLQDAGAELPPSGTPADYAIEPGKPALITDATAPPGCYRSGVPAAATAACAGKIVHPEKMLTAH